MFAKFALFSLSGIVNTVRLIKSNQYDARTEDKGEENTGERGFAGGWSFQNSSASTSTS